MIHSLFDVCRLGVVSCLSDFKTDLFYFYFFQFGLTSDRIGQNTENEDSSKQISFETIFKTDQLRNIFKTDQIRNNFRVHQTLLSMITLDHQQCDNYNRMMRFTFPLNIPDLANGTRKTFLYYSTDNIIYDHIKQRLLQF